MDEQVDSLGGCLGLLRDSNSVVPATLGSRVRTVLLDGESVDLGEPGWAGEDAASTRRQPATDGACLRRVSASRERPRRRDPPQSSALEICRWSPCSRTTSGGIGLSTAGLTTVMRCPSATSSSTRTGSTWSTMITPDSRGSPTRASCTSGRTAACTRSWRRDFDSSRGRPTLCSEKRTVRPNLVDDLPHRLVSQLRSGTPPGSRCDSRAVPPTIRVADRAEPWRASARWHANGLRQPALQVHVTGAPWACRCGSHTMRPRLGCPTSQPHESKVYESHSAGTSRMTARVGGSAARDASKRSGRRLDPTEIAQRRCRPRPVCPAPRTCGYRPAANCLCASSDRW